MNSVERTVVAATRAYGDIVQEIRPLNLTPSPAEQTDGRPAREPGSRALAPLTPRARRLRSWLGPAAAAAAVLAIGISLVIVRGIPNGGAVSPAAPPAASGVPAYYVALMQEGWFAYAPLSDAGATMPTAPLMVGATFTGKRLATVPPPRGNAFTGVTGGAADDRTFVVSAETSSVSANVTEASLYPRQTWYLLRIRPGSTPAYRLSRLPIPVTPPGSAVEGTALSPDGTELALALQPGAYARKPGPELLRVYSVTTGALLRSWSGPALGIGIGGAADSAGYGLLSWAEGGRELAFNYRWSTGPYAGPKGTPNRDKALRQDRDYRQVRVLDLSRPGGNLLADSRVIWSASTPVLSTAATSPLTCSTNLLLTSDGSTLVCGAWGTLRNPGNMHPGPNGCPAIPPWNDRVFLQYSAATARVVGVIGRWQTSCPAGSQPIALLWAAESGSPLIGYMSDRPPATRRSPASDIGVYTANGYTPLPNLPASATPFTTAW